MVTYSRQKKRHFPFAVRGFICVNLEVEKATVGLGGIGIGVGVIALGAAA